MSTMHYKPCACKTKSGSRGDMDRRAFLRRSLAAGAATGMLAEQWTRADIEALYAAGRSDDARAIEDALAAWTRGLREMGSRRYYRNDELDNIAFPLGGIGAGQVYLRGDGRLWSWQISNNFQSGHEMDGAFFAVHAKKNDSASVCRLLRRDPDNADCIKDVVWSGEYPLAWLHYTDDALPVTVDLEAWSPFVPLNMKDSGLPAAVFTFTLHNNTDAPVDASLLASMPNLVGWDGYAPLTDGGLGGPEFIGNENTADNKGLTFASSPGDLPALDRPLTLATHDSDAAYHLRLCENLTVALGAHTQAPRPRDTVYWIGVGDALPPDDAWHHALDAVHEGAGLVIFENGHGILPLLGKRADERPAYEIFEDFESGNYNNWTIEGDCFGDGPARGTLPGQQPVTGYNGEFLVNTFLGGDGTTGRAVSKPFIINHSHIHLLVGGGNHPGETCVNLKIGDEVVHSATGHNEERLRSVVWDVSQFTGSEAVIEIVDAVKAGWGHINVDHIVFSDSAASPHTSPEILERLREALPFRFSGVTTANDPAAIVNIESLPLLDALPPEHRKVGVRCVFENMAPNSNANLLASDANGMPLIVSGACGKGRIVVCNGLRLSAMPGPMRKNVYGGLIALAMNAAYTPQTGWPDTGAHYGSMALCAIADRATQVSALAQWDDFNALWPAFAKEGHLNNATAPAGAAAPGRTWNGALAARVTLAAGERKTMSFLLTWHFPNRMRDHRYGWGPKAPQYDHRLGNMYNHWFKNAGEAADYILGNFRRLHSETHRFHDAFYETTLPRYVLDAITANIATIRSPLYMWLEDGTIAGFEGTDACCPMNCTHVYNYAMTPAYLFPAMERNVRETDLLAQMHPTESYIPHRTVLPLSEPRLGFEIGGPHHPALDGEFGALLKVYREYRQCGYNDWLKALWPRMKQHLLYLMASHDPDGDGVIRGEQPNTYDIHTYGSNTFIGTLYLCTLRAMEELAGVVNDNALARLCRERFEKGADGYDKVCWNGAYYYNVYDAPNATPETYNQGNCWGAGCHADQLLGQWWANLLDLGYLLPRERVRSALEAIYRYCWRGRLDLPEHKQRVFADPWERGLLNCAWPDDGRPEHPVLYCDEVWTGIEYEVAALLLHEGMVEEALQIIRAARDRYTGNQRNPYSEIECGSHYARAMSSWSLLPAAAGFQYHEGKHSFGFAPRFQPNAFTAFFITAAGYGVASQQRAEDMQVNRIAVQQGTLTLKTIRLETLHTGKPKISLEPICRHQVIMSDNTCVITLRPPITLSRGQTLSIEIAKA